MTPAERRVVDELHQYADIAVTDKDIEQAREQLYARIDARSDRRTRATLMAVAAAAVVAALVGVAWWAVDTWSDRTQPADEPEEFLDGQPPTPDLLEGIWVSAGDGSDGTLAGLAGREVIRFSREGTFLGTSNDGGYLHDTPPSEFGDYTINGRRVTFTNDGGAWCEPGARWSWQAAVPSDGLLHVVWHESLDADNDCAGEDRSEETFVRVSPSSAGSPGITALEPGSGQELTLTPYGVRGLFLQEGGEYLLSLNHEDGTYALDSRGELFDDPADSGTFELDDDARTLTLTSDSSSRECTEGDQLVMQDVVPEELHPRAALRGDVATDTCGDRIGGAATWIRLAPGYSG
jgi:hypothetical protein